MGKKLRRGAKFGKEMTLGEVEAFIAEARRDGHGDKQKVFVSTSWKQGISWLEVDDEKIVESRPGRGGAGPEQSVSLS